MPWVTPSSDNMRAHAKVLVWAGRNKREGHIVATRTGEVAVRYLTMDRNQHVWMKPSRIISVEVDSPQLELDI